jgi:Txe/YoeB family toxin of Txe-Axe toxin-antitoxin module
MKPEKRVLRVCFINAKLFAAFNQLKQGTSEEQAVASAIDRAIADLKINPLCGIRIPSRLWPREYVRKYKITNLYKYNLVRGWRMVYTIVGNEVEIISIILEWFGHKEYERRFGYKGR